MTIRGILLVLALFVGGYAVAQVPAGCSPSPHTLPDDLRSSLDQRFSEFLAAQAEGQWDSVAELLGRCRFGWCVDGQFYSSSYKQCIVSRMQELRILSFDLSNPDLYTCSTKMELPAGTVARLAAEQLSWYLRGTAGFHTSAEDWTELTQVEAYRDRGQWYFIPPQQSMQSKWEKIHFTQADLLRDRREEVEIGNRPSSPIEITVMHVYMDRKFPLERNVHFRLRNKTSKKVIALRATIGDESGAIDFGGPYQIAPKGYIALDQGFSAYGDDFCDGVRQRALAIAISEVDFADGSKWKFKQSGDGKKR
jgi:hypothetical protein